MKYILEFNNDHSIQFNSTDIFKLWNILTSSNYFRFKILKADYSKNSLISRKLKLKHNRFCKLFSFPTNFD